jgi:uncharacterized RDD family membrane protein YckC
MSQQYESAPQAPPEPAYSAGGASGPRAGFWQRAAALIIDILVLAIPTIVLYLIDPNLGNIGGLVLGAIYFTVMDGGPNGQTFGKRALGIRVYDLRQGGPIGYGRGFLRWLVMDLLSWIFLLGYLWMLWDKEKQCWQDKAAGSVVVPADAYR